MILKSLSASLFLSLIVSTSIVFTLPPNNPDYFLKFSASSTSYFFCKTCDTFILCLSCFWSPLSFESFLTPFHILFKATFSLPFTLTSLIITSSPSHPTSSQLPSSLPSSFYTSSASFSHLPLHLFTFPSLSLITTYLSLSHLSILSYHLPFWIFLLQNDCPLMTISTVLVTARHYRQTVTLFSNLPQVLFVLFLLALFLSFASLALSSSLEPFTLFRCVHFNYCLSHTTITDL